MDTTTARRAPTLFWLSLGVLCACVSNEGAPRDSGPRVSIEVAALGLGEVGDVVWDLEVVNGKTPVPDVVWRQRITSSRFGDGRGSATYVGPCDASPGVAQNTVRLWVVGLYDAPVTTSGTFGSGSAAGVVGTAIPFENPTRFQPLTRTLTCAPNTDTPVVFDLTLMRPASQGFFDIAVTFDDIFCSAKFDCCVEDDSGACTSDLELLHDASGKRATTYVLGFACTAGTNTDVETELYLDALELDCTPPHMATGFAADLVLDPSGSTGNQCVAGQVDACGAVSSTTLDADDYLFQLGVYRGLEALTTGDSPARPANKVYWNLALGGVRKGPGANAVGIENCRLRTRGTAADALGTGLMEAGTVAPGLVYPSIEWQVDLGTCRAEALTFNDPGAMVRVAYTTTSAESGTTFDYAFGPNRPAGPTGGGSTGATPCGRLGAPCPTGFVCNTALALGSSHDAFCVSDGSLPAYGATAETVFVPAGTFWMGCNAELESSCLARELPQHQVTLSRSYAIDRTEVSASAYSECVEAAACEVPVETNHPYASYGTPGKEEHPVNYVTDVQAAAYCAWDGKRLCTEAEWERAARGGCETIDGGEDPEICRSRMRQFPWDSGDGSPSLAPGCERANMRLNWQEPLCDETAFTSPVLSYPQSASPYGALNMAGNVMEWVGTRYYEYPDAPVTDPPATTADGSPVFRNGYFDSGASEIRTSFRNGWDDGREGPYESSTYYGLGFRCCKTVPTTTSTPTCTPACANGGTCTATNTCRCVAGWTGASCEIPLSGFVQIPAGTFVMGSPEGEMGRFPDETQHTVTHTRGFIMQTTEVTQAEWLALSGGVDPSNNHSCGTCPVEQVSWYAALGYANARSVMEGLTPCYSLIGCDDPEDGWRDAQHWGCSDATFLGLECDGYRLPTESEWEYAARAGTTTASYAGELTDTLPSDCQTPQAAIDDIAWWCHNSNLITSPVAQKTPNAWGLYDMLGNVQEWTWDRYGPYPGSATDPLGQPTGLARVYRGGSFDRYARYSRAATREGLTGVERYYNIGFRLVRTITP